MPPISSTERIASPWGGLLTFDGDMPVDFANGNSQNLDLDGDGVMDLHDNCVYTFNPSQYDADEDGQGEACQTIPSAGSAGGGGSSRRRIGTISTKPS